MNINKNKKSYNRKFKIYKITINKLILNMSTLNKKLKFKNNKNNFKIVIIPIHTYKNKIFRKIKCKNCIMSLDKISKL